MKNRDCMQPAGFRNTGCLNLVHRRLLVFRDPVSDPVEPFGGRYCQQQSFDDAATTSPLAAPQAMIAVSRLLP